MNTIINAKVLAIYPAIILVLGLTGCAKRMDPDLLAMQNKPDWVSGQSVQFPEHLYLTGRGEAANREAASKNAWDDLLNRLQKESAAQLPASGASLKSSITDLMNHGNFKDTGYIAASWFNPVSDTHFELAVLDRLQAGKILTDEIYILDSQIQRTLDKAKTEADSLQRIAFARLAINKIESRQDYALILRVIKPTAVIKKTDWDIAKIQGYIDEYIASTSIMPVTSESSDKSGLLSALSSGIRRAGFNVVSGQKPDYILKASVERKDITWKDGIFTLHGKIVLELLDGSKQDQVRGTTSWPIEVSANEREGLPDKLTDAITKINGDRLKQAFIDFQLN